MLKYLSLLIILCVASYFDIREKRIPNPIIIVGVVGGFLCKDSISDVFFQICTLGVLFFFGMLRIMGMGDLKLWMVISCYTGLLHSCFIMVGASVMLIIYAFLKNQKESMLIINHMKFSILLKEIPKTIEQTAYSFAPFMLLSTILYLAWRMIT